MIWYSRLFTMLQWKPQWSLPKQKDLTNPSQGLHSLRVSSNSIFGTWSQLLAATIGKSLDKMSLSTVRGTLCCLPLCQLPQHHKSSVTMRASSPTHLMCILDVSSPVNLFALILTSWMIWLHLVYGTLMSRMLCLLTMVVYSRLGAFLRRLRIYTRPFGRFLKGLS